MKALIVIIILLEKPQGTLRAIGKRARMHVAMLRPEPTYYVFPFLRCSESCLLNLQLGSSLPITVKGDVTLKVPQNGGVRILIKTCARQRASPLKKNLSIETTFSENHLVGQYL